MEAKDTFKKQETRIIPEQVPPRFYAQHLKPYEFLKNELAGRRVLELGCGDGYGLFYLAKITSGAVGIDYEEEVILQARNKYRKANLNFLCMSATELGFKDNSFDVACSFQVIEHIAENKLMLYLSEIKRVLRAGGRFYLSTLNLEHNMKSPATYKKNSAHCKEFKLGELKKLLLGVFPSVQVYGLCLAPKHRFYQRLKRIGVFNLFPRRINPVSRFYNRIATGDFTVTTKNLKKASDFICACTKNK